MFSRSPNINRKGLQQLNQEGEDDQDRVIAGVEYYVQYVGSTEVSEYCGTGSGKTEVPVAKVFEETKQKSDDKKSKKMIMTVCYKNLSVKEEASGKLVASFPISKVTFCNVDTKHEKAFVFVARDKMESPFKAYVFLCESKAKAQDLFKVLSLAFSLNYESYQASLIRQANLRSNARNSSSGSSDDNDEQKLEDTNEVYLRNGTTEDSEGQIILDRSYGAFKDGNKESDAATIPKISQPHAQGIVLVSDKRFQHLPISDSRTRSHSGPPPLMRIITNPIVHISENTKPSKTSNDDEFEAEFTQLAKSRSSTTSSEVRSFHSGSVQRWDSDPGFVRLRIH